MKTYDRKQLKELLREHDSRRFNDVVSTEFVAYFNWIEKKQYLHS